MIRIYIKRGEIPGKKITLGMQKSIALGAGILAAANILLGIFAQPLISLLTKGLTMLAR